MEELINKIKEFTLDGPPGVGQRIELSEIARKAGVKRVDLEKLIDKTIANRGNVLSPSVAEAAKITEEDAKGEHTIDNRKFERPNEESTRAYTFERPNLDAARESFEKELHERQQVERDKLKEVVPEVKQPEVVFPELNVTFGSEEVRDESPKLEEIEMPEIVQEELKSEFDIPEVPVSHIEIKTDEKPPVEDSTVEFNRGNITFEPEVEQPTAVVEEVPAVDFSSSEAQPKTPTFEESIRNTQDKLDKEDVLRKIIAETKQAKEDAERAATIDLKRKTKSNNKSQRAKENMGKSVTLAQSKSARVTGIIAFIASILPFSVVGLFAGAYGYNTAKKYRAMIATNPSIYGSTINNNVTLGFFLSIAGMVIGGFRLISIFF